MHRDEKPTAPLPRRATESPHEALTRMLFAHASALSRLTASYARTTSERDDLRQEIALALCTALPAFRGECSERTFVLRVAHNRACSFVARRGARTEDLAEHEHAGENTTRKNPAMAYERRERERDLLAAVRALPVSLRQVVTLLLEGLSHREIAEVLGTSENNVAVRATRARSALRVLLRDPGEPSSDAHQHEG